MGQPSADDLTGALEPRETPREIVDAIVLDLGLAGLMELYYLSKEFDLPVIWQALAYDDPLHPSPPRPSSA